MQPGTDAADKSQIRQIKIELFLLAAAALYFELAVIRWMSSDLRSMAVLKTFPLVACFVGLGAGYARSSDRLFRYTPLMLLAFVGLMKLSDAVGMSKLPYPTSTVYQWGVVNMDVSMWLYILFFMVWMALVLAFPFLTMMGFGARLGVLFNKLRPLEAYTVDIVGSILGSIIFSLSSFLCFAPWGMMLFPAAALALSGRDLKRAILPSILAVLVAFIPIRGDDKVVWTPYFRLELTPIIAQVNGKVNELGTMIKVNHMFQQYFFPKLSSPTLDSETETEEQKLIVRVRRSYYNLPYCFKPAPENVLVLGCGTGQDVLAAVQHGARSVDAIEIDPVVVSLGKKWNPAFSSDKVHVYNADARHFVMNGTKKYDLIVFACLDSLGVTGLGSSVRIDSYVHTKESLMQTLSLLREGGVLVMSFGAGGQHWLRDRLYGTLKEAAGFDPLYFTDEKAPERWPAFVYVACPSNHDISPVLPVAPYEQEKIDFDPESRILTDDWPYLYLSPKRLDLPFALLVLEIIGLSLFVSRRMLFARDNEPSSWQMMFLGAAFLLLELQAISRLSLIFGTTWLTSAVVINGVLIMILLANLLVLRVGEKVPFGWAYGLLFVNLIVNYFLPTQKLMAGSMGEFGTALIVVLTLLPMFMAGIIFAGSFNLVNNAARALGFNLLGAVMGALLELLSGVTGVRALVLIAAALYLCSYYFFKKSRTAKAEIKVS